MIRSSPNGSKACTDTPSDGTSSPYASSSPTAYAEAPLSACCCHIPRGGLSCIPIAGCLPELLGCAAQQMAVNPDSDVVLGQQTGWVKPRYRAIPHIRVPIHARPDRILLHKPPNLGPVAPRPELDEAGGIGLIAPGPAVAERIGRVAADESALAERVVGVHVLDRPRRIHQSARGPGDVVAREAAGAIASLPQVQPRAEVAAIRGGVASQYRAVVVEFLHDAVAVEEVARGRAVIHRLVALAQGVVEKGVRDAAVGDGGELVLIVIDQRLGPERGARDAGHVPVVVIGKRRVLTPGQGVQAVAHEVVVVDQGAVRTAAGVGASLLGLAGEPVVAEGVGVEAQPCEVLGELERIAGIVPETSVVVGVSDVKDRGVVGLAVQDGGDPIAGVVRVVNATSYRQVTAPLSMCSRAVLTPAAPRHKVIDPRSWNQQEHDHHP